jgi:hypothetical protein
VHVAVFGADAIVLVANALPQLIEQAGELDRSVVRSTLR